MSDGRVVIDTDLDESGVEQGLKDLKKNIKDGADSVVNAADIMNGAFQAISLSDVLDGVSAVSGKMLSVVGDMVTSSLDFEDAMAKVATIADSSVVPIGNMQEAIVDLSNETGIAATDIADNVYNAISAGQDTADAVDFVRKATSLATAGFASSAESIDILTTIMNAYGMEATEVDRVSDALIQTQNLGKTTVGELASAMGRVVPTAKSYSVELEQITTGYAVMTSNGIATAETTTYMNSMLNELGKSGTKVSDILKNETGQSFSELMEGGYSLSDVLEIVRGSAEADGLAFNDVWSSAEAGKAALVLLGDSADNFNGVLGEMQNSAGSTETAFETMQTTSYTLGQAQTQLKNAAMDFGGALIETAQPAIKLVCDAIKGLTNWFKNLSGPAKTIVTTVIAVGATAGVVVPKIVKLVNAFKAFKGMIGSVVSGFVNFIKNLISGGAATATNTTAMGANTVATGANAVAAGADAGAKGAEATATEGATVAQWLLNAAQEASPMMWLLAGLTALAVALGVYFNCCHDLRDEHQKMIDSAEESRKALAEANQELADSLENIRTEVAKAESSGEAIRPIIDELEELNAKETLTNEEQERMRVLTTEVAAAFPELGLEIDSVTGKLNKTNEEIEDYIKNVENSAKVNAYQQAITDTIQAQTDAFAKKMQLEVDLEDLVADQNTLIDQQNALMEANEERINERNAAEEAMNKIMDQSSDEYIELANRVQELSDTTIEWNGVATDYDDVMLELNRQIEDAQKEIDKCNEEIEEQAELAADAQHDLDRYAEKYNELTGETQEATKATEKNTQETKLNQSAKERQIGASAALAAGLGGEREAMEKATEAAKLQEQRMGALASGIGDVRATMKDAEGIHRTYALNLASLASGMASQAGALNDLRFALDEENAAREISISTQGEELMAFQNLSEGMQQRAADVMSAVVEMENTITGSIKNQIDWFSAWEQGTSLSFDQIMANLQSNITGLKNWETNLATIAQRDKDGGLYAYLQSLGPDGAAMVQSFVDMTDEQFAEAASSWSEAMQIQEFGNAEADNLREAVGVMAAGGQEAFDELAEDLHLKADESGGYTVEGLCNGITNAIDDVVKAGKTAGNSLLESLAEELGVHSPSWKAEDIGEDTGQGLINGFSNQNSSVWNEAMKLAVSAMKALRGAGMRDAAYQVGQNFADGLRSGIADATQSIANQAAATVRSAINAANAEQNAHSPAKETIKVGHNFGEGEAVGIMDREKDVVKASASVMESALDELQRRTILAKLRGAMDSVMGRITANSVAGRSAAAGIAASGYGMSERDLETVADRVGSILADAIDGMGIRCDGREFGRVVRAVS